MEIRRRPQTGKMDHWLYIAVLGISAFGLVMMFSASYYSAQYSASTNHDGFFYLRNQVQYLLIGIVGMYVMSRIQYRYLEKLKVIALVVTILLMIAVVFWGRELNGAKRWLKIGGLPSFQPSELAKMAVVIYFSATISKKREKMQTWSQGIWPYVLILGVIALLMMREPHLSGTILIVCTGIVLMIVGGIKGWLIPLGIGGVGLVGALYVILVQKGILHYGENRINTWRDPFNAEWYRGDGWQIAQCLIAIGSGGLLGVGLGKGRQKFLYLPEEHNDCIFAVICEELGLVGACVIMLVFALLILRGFWIALHARDRFGALLVVGFMTLTGLQTFLNIAVVTGLVPATGISLPFFSYGGTALLCQLAEMGIVLSVSRQMPAPENG